MKDHIDYDPVAEIHDRYTATIYDHDLILNRVAPGVPVLELMSGTGRAKKHGGRDIAWNRFFQG